MTTESPKKRLSAAERRSAFLQAAEALLQDSGIEALTMERLAAVCGVNKALPYRFFANRDEVLVALMEEEYKIFDAGLVSRRRSGMSFREEITALVENWVEFMEEHKAVSALSVARTSSGKLESIRTERTRSALQFFRELIVEKYDMDTATARLCAGVLLSSALGFSQYWYSHQGSKESLVPIYVNMVVGAVEAVVNSRPE